MESLDYDTVKAAVLRAYELVPEAYRQKFRAWLKQAKQTNVEFAREKKNLFEKWCLASKVTTYEELQELILLEDFKTCVPENVVVYLNEQKVSSFLMQWCLLMNLHLPTELSFPLGVNLKLPWLQRL